jgi:hypothetical protein
MSCAIRHVEHKEEPGYLIFTFVDAFALADVAVDDREKNGSPSKQATAKAGISAFPSISSQYPASTICNGTGNRYTICTENVLD